MLNEPKVLNKMKFFQIFMFHKKHKIKNGQVAVVCSHLCEKDPPLISIAIRDKPIDKDDSGWQFLCQKDHTEDSGGVRLLCNLINDDKSLASIVDSPINSTFVKEFGNWKQVKHRS